MCRHMLIAVFAVVATTLGHVDARGQVSETVTVVQDADPSVNEAYARKVAEAIAEYDRGNWAESRALFSQAHDLAPSARTLRTLGMTAFELRDYVSALRELTAALDDPRRPLDERLKGEVRVLIDRTRAFVGRFRVDVQPATASLFIDDRPVALETDGTLLLGLGEHKLRATAPEHVPVERVLRVIGRDDTSFHLVLERVDPRAPTPGALPVTRREPDTAAPSGASRTWTWIAASGAVAFGGAAVGLKLASDDEYEALQQSCGEMPTGGCQRGELDDDRLVALETLNTVTVVTAGALAVTAVVLYFVEGAGPGGVEGVALEPAPSGITYRF